jgi:hypothetical protein
MTSGVSGTARFTVEIGPTISDIGVALACGSWTTTRDAGRVRFSVTAALGLMISVLAALSQESTSR